jgi:hypothetical protein
MMERDSFTARYWNGRARVVVLSSSVGSGLPPVHELVQRLVGTEMADSAWAALVGAADDATVEVIPDSSDHGPAIQLRVSHPWLEGPALRYLYRDSAGRLAVRNEYLEVREMAPDGVATRMLAHQIRAARQLGVAYLSAEAAGGPGSPFVGYDVWPKLGYDGLIPEGVRQRLPDQFRGAVYVLDLVTAPGGADWWRRNGRGFEATFDLHDGSRSLDVHAAYTARRGVRI